VVVALVRDIGDRVQMEQELIKLALAVEQSPVSILIANTDSEIEYVNDSFVRTTGYSRREVVGKNPVVLAAEWSGADDYRAIWGSLKNGQSWEGEFNHRHKDGTALIAHDSITPIRQPDGELTHYLVIREDITEKKRLMQELQDHRDHLEELVAMRTRELSEAREQAEAAGRVKSQFLANMSHEIRTPINSVLGLTYLLRQSDMSAGQHRRLDQIESSTKHLISVINDILDLSKIEAGKLSLERHDFDLGALMSHVETMLRDQAEAKGLKLYTEPVEISGPVSGDKRRLLQILLNYAHNAIKFTQRGEICLRALKIEESVEHVLVRFEVQDTGIGVAPDKLPHVFEAFEQADASTTRVHGGTGLGLAIARHLAQLLGGEVGVDSEPGKGSTFWFTARLKPAARVQQGFLPKNGEALPRLRRDHSGARVLLVEDDRINLEVVCELLVHAGLSVDIAEGPREALAKANERQYDLILMDVQMPGMDGLEAAQKIRSSDGHRSTPVLGMSANTSQEQRKACLAAGMDDFVAKPIDPDLLYATLLKWLPERGELPETLLPRDGAGSGSAGQVAADTVRLIDDTVLKSLLGEDQGRHREILHKFNSQAAGIIEALQAACQKHDASAVQFQSHKLKSSAGTVGAHSVSQISQALEAAGKEQDWEQVAALFAQISAELKRVSDYINGPE
jgi:PAS domain S-box-containing protein